MKIIGIDPGTNTGIAIIDYDTQTFIDIFSTDFFGCIDYLNSIKHIKDQYIIVIEDAEANKAVFGIENTYNTTKGDHKSKIAAVSKHGANVGRVKSETRLLKKFIEKNKFNVFRVRPTRKNMDGKRMGLKKGEKGDPSERFTMLTGWKRKTNEHQRDAALLVFMNRNVKDNIN